MFFFLQNTSTYVLKVWATALTWVWGEATGLVGPTGYSGGEFATDIQVNVGEIQSS